VQNNIALIQRPLVELLIDSLSDESVSVRRASLSGFEFVLDAVGCRFVSTDSIVIGQFLICVFRLFCVYAVSVRCSAKCCLR